MTQFMNKTIQENEIVRPFDHLHYVPMIIHLVPPRAIDDADMKDSAAGGQQMIAKIYCKPNNFSPQTGTWGSFTNMV